MPSMVDHKGLVKALKELRSKAVSKGYELSIETSMDMKHLYQLSPSEVPVKKVGRTKHKNGFPPNFIHSLDSSHMMLTALHLWSKGVTFASVHDCYWTHASDVPIMNKVP